MISNARAGRRDPLLAGVELGAQAAQRQVRLGRQDQREQPDLQRQLTHRQPQAHAHRHQRHRDRRQQLQRQRGQEGHPQRRHGRRAVGVGDAPQDGHLGLGPAVGAQGRQAGDDVREPVREAPEGRPSPRPVRLRHLADEDHEHRDQRDRDRHGQRGHDVDGEQAHDHRERHDRRQRQLGQVPPEVPVQRVQAARREQRHLAARLVGRPAGAERHGTLQEADAEVRLDRPADPLGHDVRGPAQHGAQRQDDREGDQRDGQPLDVQPAHERTVDRRRQEGRLGDRQQRGRHAERDGADQPAASRSGRTR